jgi:hypothetical protein
MTAAGVDYSSGRPGGAALAAAGMRFAARYLSHNEEKNLTPNEATDLAAHGVSCVVVWETTAQRAGAGRAAGITDAKEAAAQAKACGMPSSRPIYFAVDYDAAPSAVVAYFQGVASVLGLARTGVYGGYKVVAYLLDHKLASWAWQTVAWSQKRWDARAHIRQYASTVRIGGVSCDHDTAYAADFGQWMPGRNPTVQEDDMPTAQEIAAAVWNHIEQGPTGTKPVRMGAVMGWMDSVHGRQSAAVKALSAQVAAQGAAITALAEAKGGDSKAVAAAITLLAESLDAIAAAHASDGDDDTPAAPAAS